jgi:hypothetical protein
MDGTNNGSERAIGWWIKERYRTMRGYKRPRQPLMSVASWLGLATTWVGVGLIWVCWSPNNKWGQREFFAFVPSYQTPNDHNFYEFHYNY